MRELAAHLMRNGDVDFIDLSLWDVFKRPEEHGYDDRTLLSYFTDIERGQVRLGAAGNMRNPQDVLRCLDEGADFVARTPFDRRVSVRHLSFTCLAGRALSSERRILRLPGLP
jgi:2,4-dienoyl-CoA reductase-like NADH-dependent reductase (Old Yellow Enzyme family)